MKRYWKVTALLSVSLLFACEEDPILEDSKLVYSFDFKEDVQGWSSGYADYPVGEDEFYEIHSDWITLPFPLNPAKKSLMIEGNNHSDDLFMFIKRKISGLDSLTEYEVKFVVEFASNYPENSFGIGGSPGSSVYLKAGATLEEPLAVEQEGMWQMNIDKGNQAEGGEDMLVLGNIGTPREDEQYDLLSRSNDEENTFAITTDNKGELWLIVGTDSGFEGKTTLYYNRIKATFTLKE
ncbi:hypothetical protein [Catalinimonas niigatensis]|uniref:hypothetical protein n=1 Tax=Catalinimonas niigatensis TaxID=1397264 RepID=UPI0026670861|nr:hypothetical protein [Catalinimonas niigatensis]WPP52378.1 hypothetical protein PZB72_08285 [Catalinimonas niigatensis]